MLRQRKSEKEAWLRNTSYQATFFVGKFNLLTFQVQFATSGNKIFSPFFVVQSRSLHFSAHIQSRFTVEPNYFWDHLGIFGASRDIHFLIHSMFNRLELKNSINAFGVSFMQEFSIYYLDSYDSSTLFIIWPRSM